MTTKELLALVGKWRERADLEDEEGGPYWDENERARLLACADELAPIATALCAEVEALTDALARLCSNKPRTSPQIDADWDNARAVLAKFAKEPK